MLHTETFGSCILFEECRVCSAIRHSHTHSLRHGVCFTGIGRALAVRTCHHCSNCRTTTSHRHIGTRLIPSRIGLFEVLHRALTSCFFRIVVTRLDILRNPTKEIAEESANGTRDALHTRDYVVDNFSSSILGTAQCIRCSFSSLTYNIRCSFRNLLRYKGLHVTKEVPNLFRHSCCQEVHCTSGSFLHILNSTANCALCTFNDAASSLRYCLCYKVLGIVEEVSNLCWYRIGKEVHYIILDSSSPFRYTLQEIAYICNEPIHCSR